MYGGIFTGFTIHSPWSERPVYRALLHLQEQKHEGLSGVDL